MITIDPSTLCLLLVVVAFAGFSLGAFTGQLRANRMRDALHDLPCEGATEFRPSVKRAAFLSGPRVAFSRDFLNSKRAPQRRGYTDLGN
jgi:hypothetical protein